MSDARKRWREVPDGDRSIVLRRIKKLRDYYDDGAEAWRRAGANDLASVIAMTAAGYDAAIAVLEEAEKDED